MHELVYKPIVEVNAHGRLCRPVVTVIILDNGFLFDFAGNTDKWKQADSAGAVLVEPEECPHEILGGAGGDGVEILAVYPQRLRNLVQQLPLRDTVIRLVLCDTVVCSLFLKADSKPQFLLCHASKGADFLFQVSACYNIPPP